MIPVAVLGATGTVGQKFITLLDGHPLFEVAELVASDRSAGRPYREVCRWRQPTPIPEPLAGRTVVSLDADLTSRVAFSGLDSSVAGAAETRLAEAGHIVISNSKNHRMDPLVPLVIPEVNADHLALVSAQRDQGMVGDGGALVTNSNCSTMFLAMALAPLHREFGVQRVMVTTLQAISGAGYPGVPSADILGNIVPYISGEEDKLETEPRKIIGTLHGERIEEAPFHVGAQCTRVPVADGHLEAVSVEFTRRVTPGEVVEALRSFSGMPQERSLPSAPPKPIVVLDEDDRPQPLLDVARDRGMAAVVGRVRTCPLFDVRFVVLGHNTIRGAAGAAVLNAEAMHALGYLS